MADYYPLISRAVSGLDKNNGENRRSVYERARAALIAQLRGVTPPLPEADITRERLALEEAIRKVEAEAARQFAQSLAKPPPDRWEEPPRAPRAAPPPRVDLSPRRTPTPPTAPTMPSRQSDSVFDQPLSTEQPLPPPSVPSRHPLRRPAAERRSVADTGLSDFRTVVSEANELGGASARAAQSARDAYAAVPTQDRYQPRVLDPQDEPGSLPADFREPMLEPSYTDTEEVRPAPPRMRQQAMPAGDDDYAERRSSRPARSYRELIKGAGIVAAVACLGGVLLWQWPNMVGVYQRVRAPATVTATDTPAASSRSTKITDRVPAGGEQSQAPAPVVPGAAAVAQKVVLYEEDPADPNGKRFVGSAIWRTETYSPGPGQPPELAIRADIEVPDRKLAMTISLRREKEKSVMSHTMAVEFKVPADFPSGGISNVPGILMKQAEQTRGVPLAGSAVKVTNAYFLIALSGIDTERERNLQLLKERAWFDIPLVYSNNRRAILAVEKGTPGDRVFAEAFKQWKQ